MAVLCEVCRGRPIAGLLVIYDRDGLTPTRALRTCLMPHAMFYGAGFPRVFHPFPGHGLNPILGPDILKLLTPPSEIDWSYVEQLTQFNTELTARNETERVVGFTCSWDDLVLITDPLHDESGWYPVDPVLYYGDAFLASPFIRS